ADDLEVLPEVVDLLGVGVEHGREHVVLGQAVRLGDDHDALAVEHVGHRPRIGHRAAGAGHGDADLRRRAVAVVGEALDQDGDTAGRVPLVHDGLIVGAAGLQPTATLAGALDVVQGNGVLARLLDGVVERGVAVGVGATGPRRHLDVLDELGEQLAALRVQRGLLVLGRRPFRVAGHRLALPTVLYEPCRQSNCAHARRPSAPDGRTSRAAGPGGPRRSYPQAHTRLALRRRLPRTPPTARG